LQNNQRTKSTNLGSRGGPRPCEVGFPQVLHKEASLELWLCPTALSFHGGGGARSPATMSFKRCIKHQSVVLRYLQLVSRRPSSSRAKSCSLPPDLATAACRGSWLAPVGLLWYSPIWALRRKSMISMMPVGRDLECLLRLLLGVQTWSTWAKMRPASQSNVYM
jgi:hypothetical protein